MPTNPSSQPLPSPQPHRNPFTPGSVVSPERFFGRQQERSEILGRLGGMLSVSLVGEARIGKTSLLKYLEHTLASWHGYLPIYLSMNEYGTQASFCRALLDQLLPHVVPPTGQEARLRDIEQQVLQEDDTLTFEGTARMIEWAKEGGLQIVLMLDEAKDLLEKPAEFDDAFRGKLRNLYTQQKLALVLVTRQRLTEIPELNAYFANGMIQLELAHLLPSDAEALLRQPHDRPFSDKEVQLGLDVSDEHPFRLQSAGYRLYFWQGQADNPLYATPNRLHHDARNILHRVVQEEHHNVMQASQEHTERTTGISGWLGDIGQLLNRIIIYPIERTLTFIETTTGKIGAVLFLLVIILAILAGLGIIPPEIVERLLEMLQEGA